MLSLPVLSEIAALYATTTDDDITRVARQLAPTAPNETAYGQVIRIEAQILWATAFRLSAMSALANYDAAFRAKSDEERDELLQQSSRLDRLSDFTRDLFWNTVKDDLGGSIWVAKEIGLRSGWMIVASAPREHKAILEKLFGFGVSPQED